MSDQDPFLILPSRDIIQEKRQELLILESVEISVDHVMDFMVDIWSMWNADGSVRANPQELYDSAFERIYDQIGDEYAAEPEKEKHRIIANCTNLTLEFYQRLKPAMDVAHSCTNQKIHYLGLHGWIGDDLVTSVITLPESESKK